MQHDSKDPGMPGAEPGNQSPPGNSPEQAGAGQRSADPTRTGEARGAEDMQFGPEQLKQIIAALQTENDKLRADFEAEREQSLRLRAEMDNMRKRGDREKSDTAKYAITKFAGDVVDVADNFERALKAVPEASSTDNPTLKALHEGVSMTEREFLKVLEKHGVRRVDPTGEIFNPHQHQAVMEQDNAEVAAGTVLQVFQSGYIIEERVLRPAMVVVARGGQKPVRQSADPGAPPAANDDKPAAEMAGDSEGGAQA